MQFIPWHNALKAFSCSFFCVAYRTVQAESNAQVWTKKRIQNLKRGTVRSSATTRSLQFISPLQADWFSEYHGQEVLVH